MASKPWKLETVAGIFLSLLQRIKEALEERKVSEDGLLRRLASVEFGEKLCTQIGEAIAYLLSGVELVVKGPSMAVPATFQKDPKGVTTPQRTYNAKVVCAWKFSVNYDEKLEAKLAHRDPLFVAAVQCNVSDSTFRSSRTGRADVVGTIIVFDADYVPSVVRDDWAKQNGKRFAEAKEFLDFLWAIPRPWLDDTMPMSAQGNCLPGFLHENSTSYNTSLFVKLNSHGRCIATATDNAGCDSSGLHAFYLMIDLVDSK